MRSGTGVLGIFDSGSERYAGGVVADVGTGIADVSAQVPYEWEGRVVVYALSDPTFLAGLEDVPGDDPLDLDAVAFPVPAGPDADGDRGHPVPAQPPDARRRPGRPAPG